LWEVAILFPLAFLLDSCNERIQQRRLARVGTPDDGDEAGSHLHDGSLGID
jgi:hypothetical protein